MQWISPQNFSVSELIIHLALPLLPGRMFEVVSRVCCLVHVTAGLWLSSWGWCLERCTPLMAHVDGITTVFYHGEV